MLYYTDYYTTAYLILNESGDGMIPEDPFHKVVLEAVSTGLIPTTTVQALPGLFAIYESDVEDAPSETGFIGAGTTATSTGNTVGPVSGKGKDAPSETGFIGTGTTGASTESGVGAVSTGTAVTQPSKPVGQENY